MIARASVSFVFSSYLAGFFIQMTALTSTIGA